jgi:hypothetical protein
VASARWTAQATALRATQTANADDLPSVRKAGGAVTLHRVAVSDEDDELFVLSRQVRPCSLGKDMEAVEVFCGDGAIAFRHPFPLKPSSKPGHQYRHCRPTKHVIRAGADMPAFLDRLSLFKARGGLQLDGTRHAVGDFTICLARAVQVCGLSTHSL